MNELVNLSVKKNGIPVKIILVSIIFMFVLPFQDVDRIPKMQPQ
jgi:hypothetical protein